MTATPIESIGFVDHDDVGRDAPERAVARPDLGLSLVVHGAAASVSGAPAAELTAHSIVERLECGREPGDAPTGGDALAEALQLANRRLHDRAYNLASLPALETFRWAGAWATVAALWWHDDALAIAHVGHCRAYRLEGGALRAVTTDHTAASELGTSPPPAGLDPAMLRDIVTRTLGADPEVAVEITVGPWSPGVPILLCTPALHRLLSVAEIAAALEPHSDLAAAGQRLLELARARRRAARDPATRFLSFTLSQRPEGPPG